MSGAQVHTAAELERLLAGHLGESAVTAAGAAGGADLAVEAGRLIRPDDDGAAVAVVDGIGA